ncbi:hypothetical protein [Kitasatospora terrestris]
MPCTPSATTSTTSSRNWSLVKGNQPRLHAALRFLPRNQVRARRYERERGHGRREPRSTRALTVGAW